MLFWALHQCGVAAYLVCVCSAVVSGQNAVLIVALDVLFCGVDPEMSLSRQHTG